MTLTDHQIRELARGVITGFVYGRKDIAPSDYVEVDINGGAAVLMWVEIPDLTLAQQQYEKNTGKTVQEAVR